MRRFALPLLAAPLLAAAGCDTHFDQDFESEDSIACRKAGYEIGSQEYEECLIDRQTEEPS